MSETPQSDRWLAGYDDNVCTLDAHATMQGLERQRDAYAETLKGTLRLLDEVRSVDYPARLAQIIRERHPELAQEGDKAP